MTSVVPKRSATVLQDEHHRVLRSEMPGVCLTRLQSSGSAVSGRVTLNGWAVVVTSSDVGEDISFWNTASEAPACKVFSVQGMGESSFETAADRVELVFHSRDDQDLIGVVFISSSGRMKLWYEEDDPTKFDSGDVALADGESCVTMCRAHIPGNLYTVCGTSSGRIFLALFLDDNGEPLSKFVVTELVQPSGLLSGLGWGMSRMLGMGSVVKRPSPVRALLVLDSPPVDMEDEIEEDAAFLESHVFVLTEHSLARWNLCATSSSFLWEDSLASLCASLPSTPRFLQLLATPHDLVLLIACDAEDADGDGSSQFFVALLSCFFDQPTVRPELRDLLLVDYAPSASLDTLRLAAYDSDDRLSVFVLGPDGVAILCLHEGALTQVGSDTCDCLTSVDCFGGGVSDSQCCLLTADGVVAARCSYSPSSRPLSKKPRTSEAGQAEEEAPQAVNEAANGAAKTLSTLKSSFRLFLERRPEEAAREAAGLPVRGAVLDEGVRALTRELIDARPLTQWLSSTDSALLIHHLSEKQNKFSSLVDYLLTQGPTQETLWVRLSAATQARVREGGEQMFSTHRLREVLQAVAEQTAPEDADVQRGFVSDVMKSVIERTLTPLENLGVADVFFSHSSCIDQVFPAVADLTPWDQQGGLTSRFQLVRCLLGLACYHALLSGALDVRQRFEQFLRKTSVAPGNAEEECVWTFTPENREHVIDLVQKAQSLLEATRAHTSLAQLREAVYLRAWSLAHSALNQHVVTIAAAPKIQQARLVQQNMRERRRLVDLLQTSSEAIDGGVLFLPKVRALAEEFEEFRTLIGMCNGGHEELLSYAARFGRPFAQVLFQECHATGHAGTLLRLSETLHRSENHALMQTYDAWLEDYLQPHKELLWLHELFTADYSKSAVTLQAMVREDSSITGRRTLLSLSKLVTCITEGSSPMAPGVVSITDGLSVLEAEVYIDPPINEFVEEEEAVRRLSRQGLREKDAVAFERAVRVYVKGCSRAGPELLRGMLGDALKVDRAEWEVVAQAHAHDLSGKLSEDALRGKAFWRAATYLASCSVGPERLGLCKEAVWRAAGDVYEEDETQVVVMKAFDQAFAQEGTAFAADSFRASIARPGGEVAFA